MKIKLIAAAIVAVMLAPVLSVAGDVVLIGHPSVPVSTLTRYEVSNIFLGKKSAWDSKEKINFGIQKKSASHKVFCKEYLNKSPSQFAIYWKKLVFAGTGFTPHTLSSDKEMVQFVSNTKGAIGYVSSSTPLEKVKTISIK